MMSPRLKAASCPITSEPFEDPVIALDGHSYERSAIQQWFDSGHRSSPMTGAELTSSTCLPTTLIPNHTLRGLVSEITALEPPVESRPRRQLEALVIANARLRERLAQRGQELRLAERSARAHREQLRAQNQLVNELVFAQCGESKPREDTERSTTLSLIAEQLDGLKKEVVALCSPGAWTVGSTDSDELSGLTARDTSGDLWSSRKTDLVDKLHDRLLMFDLLLSMGRSPSTSELRVYQIVKHFGKQVLEGEDLRTYEKMLQYLSPKRDLEVGVGTSHLDIGGLQKPWIESPKGTLLCS